MTRQDITYQDKLNELRLDITHPNSRGLAFVFVEGHTDIRFFRKIFNLDNCKVESIPGGNSKVETAVSELLPINNFIIGIRDADFINLNGDAYTNVNIFLTDLHDMEMSLISDNQIFSSIILEFTNIPQNQHEFLKQNIISAIEKVSLLKWLNQRDNLKIKFEGTGFHDLISFATNDIDFNQYFSRLLSKSPNAVITDISEIINRINILKALNPDAYQLCNGHDFMKTFAHYLRQNSRESIGEELISSIFRIKYDKNTFLTTQLYQNTNNWAIGLGIMIY